MKSRKSNSNSDSDSNGNSAIWTKEVSSVQVIYSTQEYKRNNGYGSDDDVTYINQNELQSLKKNARRKRNVLRNVEKYTSRSVSVQKEEKFLRTIYRVKQPTIRWRACNGEKFKDWKR